MKKNGGKIQLRAHVEEVLIEGGRAVGVRLRDGRTVIITVCMNANSTSMT